MASGAGAALVAATLLCLSGCSNLGYYWQSATGHLRVLQAARPVEDWLGDAGAPDRLKAKLALSQRIRAYASRELALPDNPSYTRYADLQRSAVIWNVTAAPEFSVKLNTWCFPFTGCVTYRGYYDEAAARAEAARLAAEGMETGVSPVPAYSTLGYLNWAGGDPLLNTFIHYPDGELARLIFHELAHQVVYARDDTMFNESFATAVERIGITRWLQTEASEAARRDYAEYDRRRQQFRALTRATRERLEALYASSPKASEAERAALGAAKAAVMADFRAQYARLRDSWGGDAARWRNYDLWVARANNASFGAQATYDELVPGFEGLFASLGGDWRRFYDEARRLATVPKAQRHQFLKSKESPRA